MHTNFNPEITSTLGWEQVTLLDFCHTDKVNYNSTSMDFQLFNYLHSNSITIFSFIAKKEQNNKKLEIRFTTAQMVFDYFLRLLNNGKFKQA